MDDGPDPVAALLAALPWAASDASLDPALDGLPALLHPAAERARAATSNTAAPSRSLTANLLVTSDSPSVNLAYLTSQDVYGGRPVSLRTGTDWTPWG